MSTLSVARERVQTYLTEIFDTVSLDSDGDYGVSRGSAKVFVRVQEFGEEHSIVSVFAPVILDAPVSAELYEAIHGKNLEYIFGHFVIEPVSETNVNVVMRHRLLGTYLDEAELGFVVVGMLTTVDEIDDEFAAQFGGRVFQGEQ